MTGVVVVASSPVVRAGLEAFLREDPRFAVIPSTRAGLPVVPANGAEATVLLLETASIDSATTSRVLDESGGLSTVLLVNRLGRASVRHALRSGVRAILPRDATGPEIIAAIEAVALGLTVLGGDEIDALLPAQTDAIDNLTRDEPLSARELEVLAMMAEGFGNKEIAARLTISEHTVKFHVSSILGKLSATTRGEAVARGVRQGFITI